MDWSKVDPGLAAALADDHPARRYTVFVHLDAGSGAVAGDGPVRTATVSAAEIHRLTDRDEVRFLRLSGRLKPAEEP